MVTEWADGAKVTVPVFSPAGLSLSDYRELITTALTEAVVMAVVIAVSAVRRQRRRARCA